MITEWNGDKRRQMKYCVNVFHRFPDAIGIPYVALKNFHISDDILRQRIKPSPVIKGVIIHKSSYLISLFYQFFHQMAAYKSVRSRYQYFLSCSHFYI